MEWCRLVGDKTARGTNAVPLLYQQSVLHQQDLGIQSTVFMVDVKATKLLDYYKRWTITEELSDAPVACDEFEVGRRSHVLRMPMGEKGTAARAKFTAAVRIPCLLACTVMPRFE